MNVISLPIKVGAAIPVCISNTVEALNLYCEKSVQGATQEAGAPPRGPGTFLQAHLRGTAMQSQASF